ncbi:glycosyltransferase [Thioclava indica]|uniref:Glycosyl transferase family 1 domain-containing protein n=1 Tax=Thioclava indica TaxID=1353528 RepID=A0A074JQQ6_9RHOB|nr:glycosyltransferase [Thioclava indica]KEO58235.1 hypothetical protein DT23_16675 [Thioclava indica]
MARLRVVHLVDDTTAGGVMRVLDHIMTAPGLSETLDHSLRCVDRRNAALGHIEADIIVSHLAISWRLLPTLIALRARHPRAAIVHVEHSYTEGFVTANVTHTRRFATLLRLSYRLFNRVVAVSHAQGDWLVRSGAVRASALRVVQSCVDLSAFRALPAVSPPVRVIGAIGRLDRQKGFDSLITAFRRTTRPDISLLIYGEGPEEATLRDLASGDARIRFMGFAPDPVAAMATVDAVAMPSLWEAYGLVAIEALAAGRALLVNRVDGLSDHLAHGAYAVEDSSITAWEHAINDLAEGHIQPSPDRGNVAQTPEDLFAAQWTLLGKDLVRA